jgi:lysophospholipase L1-like esterase
MIGKLLVAGVFIAGLGYILLDPEPDVEMQPTGPMVIGLVGDSLAVGLAKAMPDAKASATGGTSAVQWTRGQYGQRLTELLKRDVTIVLFSLGTNDLASPNFKQEVLNDAFNAIADKCRLAGVQAIFLEPPREQDRGPIAEAAASADCLTIPGIKVSMAPGDTIHPSGKGYQEWAVHIRRTLENG